MNKDWLALIEQPDPSRAEMALVRYQAQTLSAQIGERIQFALARRFYDRRGPG